MLRHLRPILKHHQPCRKHLLLRYLSDQRQSFARHFALIVDLHMQPLVPRFGPLLLLLYAAHLPS